MSFVPSCPGAYTHTFLSFKNFWPPPPNPPKSCPPFVSHLKPVFLREGPGINHSHHQDCHTEAVRSYNTLHLSSHRVHLTSSVIKHLSPPAPPRLLTLWRQELVTLLATTASSMFSMHLRHSRHSVGEGNGTPLQYSCLENPMDGGAWWAAVHEVARSQTWLSDFPFTFHFHALEKEMATHSGVLAWRIPGTEEPVGLLSMGSHRVGHDWSNLAVAAASTQYIFVQWMKKWMDGLTIFSGPVLRYFPSH